MQSLILLRGLPGCGKSTLAALLSENGTWPVYSVDDYFTDPDTGRYRFDFQNNHLAYRQCEERTRDALASGAAKVFVANTFTLEWELEPYFRMARDAGCRVFVVTVENRHGGTTVHDDITPDQLRKMAEKYRVVLGA
jgi:predicted kinase